MNLSELKQRINTTLSDEQLQVKLDDAQDFIFGYLNRSYENDSEPNRVKKVIAKYVESDLSFGVDGVKSESIGGMNQTFESLEERDNAFIKELAKLRLRKLMW